MRGILPLVRLGVEAAIVDGVLVPGDVELADGVIRAVGVGGGGRGIAIPGLVDLQVNGAGGVDLLGADASGWRRAGEALAAAGTTAYLPTFVTAPEADLRAALGSVPARGHGARVLGAHLEGPFLSPRRLGVHDPAAARAPDRALLRRLLEAGPVAQVTLAPELPGALELVDALVARGVVAALGHTEATAAQAHAAFDRGARTVVHLHNAMAPGTHREPGVAVAALAREDVIVQLIVDGEHLAPDTVRVAWRAARGRVALVSDAVADRLGTRVLRRTGGAVRGPEGQLAGGRATLLDGVRALHALGVPLPDAVGAATAVPARLLRRPDVGRLAAGAPADVVVLDDRLEVLRVLLSP